ncbi:MAG: LytR family transcriptional regulator [Clostridium sp.]|jgi:polyisoprenyl-teichoic acid--peptidoglycan teichoic acid transferase
MIFIHVFVYNSTVQKALCCVSTEFCAGMMQGNERMDQVKKRKTHTLRNISVLILSLLMLVAGIGCVYADSLLNQINFVDPQEEEISQEPASSMVIDSTTNTDDAKAGILGGLYHDDAITNILLLGVDNYQAHDTGRSDSMMLVSVDTRHKKIKLTSFLRDLYVAIPGIGSNRLNAAYSLSGGKTAGAKAVVTAIEANFGVDIDRFVIIDNSAFNKIIDRLGGVKITLTDETDAYGRTEADLINLYSGDSNKVHTGENILSGAQAHYYARIRAIGDDFERTERQRKVFSSIVDSLKGSSLPTIYSALADTLNLVTTNMTKQEILSLASNSLTYLNYPISQNRVPANNEYSAETVLIGGDPASVLVPDLDKCRETIATFIYEDDIPDKVYNNAG